MTTEEMIAEYRNITLDCAVSKVFASLLARVKALEGAVSEQRELLVAIGVKVGTEMDVIKRRLADVENTAARNESRTFAANGRLDALTGMPENGEINPTIASQINEGMASARELTKKMTAAVQAAEPIRVGALYDALKACGMLPVTWTCECNYMNAGVICTHCGKAKPPAVAGKPSTGTLRELQTRWEENGNDADERGEPHTAKDYWARAAELAAVLDAMEIGKEEKLESHQYSAEAQRRLDFLNGVRWAYAKIKGEKA